MSDDEYRSALHKLIHTLFDMRLGTCIYRARSLVEDEHGRICYRGSCNCKELTLTLREIRTVRSEHRLIAVFEVGDEIVGICELRRSVDLLICRIELAVADIVHYSAREQVSVLKNYRLRAAEVVLLYLVDVYPVIAYLSVGDVVETVDEVRDSGLACAGRADECYLLTCLRVEAYAVEDGLFRLVAEVYVIELDISADLGIGYRTVSLVRVLPCPFACALVGR